MTSTFDIHPDLKHFLEPKGNLGGYGYNFQYEGPRLMKVKAKEYDRVQFLTKIVSSVRQKKEINWVDVDRDYRNILNDLNQALADSDKVHPDLQKLYDYNTGKVKELVYVNPDTRHGDVLIDVLYEKLATMYEKLFRSVQGGSRMDWTHNDGRYTALSDHIKKLETEIKSA